MYQVNYKNLKEHYNRSIITFIGVLIALFLCMNVIFNAQIKKISMDSSVKSYDIQIQERTSDGQITYRPTYYYMVNGKKYTHTIQDYRGSAELAEMKDKTTIYYKSEAPNNCVSEYELKMNWSGVFPILLLILILFESLNGIFKARKRIKKVEWLAENGTLVKGLEYDLVRTALKINKRRIMAIQTWYELPNGTTLELIGDPRYDLKTRDKDGLVDLLIDLDNVENYYIDFNID